METLHKQIIEKLFGVSLEDDDLILRGDSTKVWTGYDKNLSKSIKRGWDRISYMLNHPGEDPECNSILDWLFTKIVISEDEDRAIKAMKRIKRHRDWNLFEIDHITVNGKDYTVVWD